MIDFVGGLFLLFIFLVVAVPWMIISPALTLANFPFLVAIFLIGLATLGAFSLALYSLLASRRRGQSSRTASLPPES